MKNIKTLQTRKPKIKMENNIKTYEKQNRNKTKLTNKQKQHHTYSKSLA